MSTAAKLNWTTWPLSRLSSTHTVPSPSSCVRNGWGAVVDRMLVILL